MSTGDAEMFADLAMQLHGQASVADTVERVVQFAVQAVGYSKAGSRWRHDGRQRDMSDRLRYAGYANQWGFAI